MGVTFNTLNAEGNAKPYYATNSQGTTFNGGAMYRTGLGSAPSTDPDFAFEVDSVKANMPTVINMFVGQGYATASGGGIARILGGAVIDTKDRSGYFSYFNENVTNLNAAYLTDPEFNGQAVNFTALDHYYAASKANNDYRPMSRLILNQDIAAGVGATVDVPLIGVGFVTIVLRRNDSSSGYGHVVHGLFSGMSDLGSWLELGRTGINATYDIITTVAWNNAIDGLSITYTSPTALSVLEVYFTGSTRTDVIN